MILRRRFAATSSPAFGTLTREASRGTGFASLQAGDPHTHERSHRKPTKAASGTVCDGLLPGMLCENPDFKEGITGFLEKRPPRFALCNPGMPADPPPLPAE